MVPNPSVTTIVPNVDPAQEVIDSILQSYKKKILHFPQNGTSAIFSTMATVDEGYNIMGNSTNSNNPFKLHRRV
ncbi:hypothetical protein Glove_67g40 [Diversispora epigaea]|uniref:Uncharacterized protein n=1 Tax=Diversispora epigaea TaxID=1348612 RepID=A0A397JES5_9GLOM|nr:hypothetical protein Glove_67g40 [Diversispora epigaea]